MMKIYCIVKRYHMIWWALLVCLLCKIKYTVFICANKHDQHMEMCSLFFFSGSIAFAYFKKEIWAIPIVAFAQWVKNLKESTRMLIQSLATISGLRMQHCFRVYQTSKMSLRTNVVMAVAQANTWSSDLTPSSGTSIC